MKINTIVNRYILKEMIPPFIINLGFLTFVFLLTRIVDITNMVVNYRASISSILMMLLYSMPAFLEFTIPMSVMMAVLLTFLRMAADREIIAVKAGGGNIYTVLYPVLFFCIIGTLLTLFMTVRGVPWGKHSYETMSADIVSSGINAGFKERTFNDGFDGIVIYVNKIDIKSKMLHDVFIEDSRNKENITAVIAPRGMRFFNPGMMSFTLRLYDGMINQVNLEDNSVNTVRFDTYDINIDFKKQVAQKKKRKSTDEMELSELLDHIEKMSGNKKKQSSAIMELHEKFSIPFACLALGLLAVPLGLKSAFSRRSSGLGLGLGCFLFYYLLLGLGWSLGKSGKLPPAVAMWAPDLLMGMVGIVLLIRVAEEKPILPDIPLYKVKQRLFRLMAAFRGVEKK